MKVKFDQQISLQVNKIGMKNITTHLSEMQAHFHLHHQFQLTLSIKPMTT